MLLPDLYAHTLNWLQQNSYAIFSEQDGHSVIARLVSEDPDHPARRFGLEEIGVVCIDKDALRSGQAGAWIQSALDWKAKEQARRWTTLVCSRDVAVNPLLLRFAEAVDQVVYLPQPG